MIKELEAISEKINEMHVVHKVEKEALQQQIETLKATTKLTEFLEKTPELTEAAKKAGKTLDAYIVEIVELVKSPNMPLVPIRAPIYERLQRIAEMRCKTVLELMQMEDVKERIETALDNLVY